MVQKRKSLRKENALFVAATVIYIFSVLYAIIVKRSYYADGVNFLETLINQRYHTFPLANDASVMRIGINLINQIPVIIALKIGITDIDILQILFSIPLFLCEIAGMAICLKIAGKEKRNMVLFPIASFAFFGILSEIFVINQVFTAVWFYWILFFFTIQDKKMESVLEYIIFSADLLIIPFSHETIIPVGFLLIGILITEVFIKKNRHNLICKGLILCDLVFAILYNLVYMNTHQAVSKSSYFLALFNLIDLKNILKSNLFITILGLFLVVIYIFKAIPKWIEVFFVTGGIIYIFINYICRNNNPVLEYSYRSLITIGTFGGIFLAYLWSILSESIVERVNIKNWYRLTAIVLMLQSVWQIGNSVNWSGYLKQFKKQISNNTGFIQDQLSGHPYAWGWTPPELSLLEAESWDEIKVIVLPHGSFITLDENGLWIPFSQVDKRVFNYDLLYQYSDQIP